MLCHPVTKHRNVWHKICFKPCNSIGDIGNCHIDFGNILAVVGLVIEEYHLVQSNASLLRDLLELTTLVCLVDVEVRVEHVLQMISLSNRKLRNTMYIFYYKH